MSTRNGNGKATISAATAEQGDEHRAEQSSGEGTLGKAKAQRRLDAHGNGLDQQRNATAWPSNAPQCKGTATNSLAGEAKAMNC